jgi:hypothetical protein
MKQCGPEGLATIFRVEVDGLLLGQMLQALQQQWKQQASSTPAQSHQRAQQQLQQPAATNSTPAQSQEQQQQRGPAEGVSSEAMLVLRMLQSLTGRRAVSTAQLQRRPAADCMRNELALLSTPHSSRSAQAACAC